MPALAARFVRPLMTSIAGNTMVSCDEPPTDLFTVPPDYTIRRMVRAVRDWVQSKPGAAGNDRRRSLRRHYCGSVYCGVTVTVNPS
jgi:hypothetical protein